jgi:hypothetical protein
MMNWLQKLDCYLRNTTPHKENELVEVDEDFWEALHSRHDPIRTKVYWAVYRFFANHIIFHPTDIYSEIKWFIQRGRRGWSDRDTWSLDWYLCTPTMMPAALRYLKAHKHGTPFSMFPTDAEYIKPCGNPTDKAEEIAVARWDACMDKMIVGFEAAWRIQDNLYEKELGPYPMRRPDGVSKEDWRKVGNDRHAASRLLEERDHKLFEEGGALFVSHFFSLWD